MATTFTKNAYRADHIGSFLRPKELLQIRAAKPNSPELRAAEDREILRILAKQKELGFDIFTDGEFRRESFMSDLVDAVDGFSTSDAHARDWKTSSGTGTQPLLDVVNR
jgi:5-methyltetrahydropteroyltriglutamate--homocysteine methyltransferase